MIASIGVSFAQSKNGKEVATLYRDSRIVKNARLHVATFDAAKNGFYYNWENCMVAAKLFQSQGGVKTKFWCEKGFFKE